MVGTPLADVVNDLKGEHLTPIMSTDRNVPGQTAPHGVSAITPFVHPNFIPLNIPQ